MQIQGLVKQSQPPQRNSVGAPRLSARAAQLMAGSSSKKGNKKRGMNEFRSQGILEVQEILDDHDSKFGSALDGDQLLGAVQEQAEEVQVAAGD